MSVKKKIAAEEHGGVLVLNQAYQPIGTTPLTRALLKINLEDSPYYVEAWSETPINRPNGETQRKPSVVRMKRWEKKIPFRKTKSTRKFVFQRDRFTCQYCAQQFKESELTLDHIFPRSRGGDNDSTNLVTACKACNNRKADRDPTEARMPLINPLTVYRIGSHLIQFCQYIDRRPEWRPYLYMSSEDEQVA